MDTTQDLNCIKSRTKNGTTYGVPKQMAEKRIKLCHIQNGNRNDIISCRLSSAVLNHNSKYKCLSYVWGSQQNKQLILLNDEEHYVTRNLHAALWRLREAGVFDSIWIDAICINQQDDQDKKVQVAMMDHIFKSASEVLVWLGEDSVGTVLGPAVDQSISILAKDAHFHDLPTTTHCKSRACPSVLNELANGGHSWPAILTALRSWFDVAWFHRAWTVQEIVLAQRATLLLGCHILSWEAVMQAFSNLGKHMRTCCSECVYGLPGDDSKYIYEMASRIIDLSAARHKVDEGQHLVDPLLQFSWKQATDPRDKLYGLLGLQSGKRPTLVTPDYTASLQAIFSRFAADVVRTQSWLMPLCLDLEQEIKDLPSWVPDWTVRSESPAVYTTSRFTWTWTYNVCKRFAGYAHVDNDYVLSVKGMAFDTIVAVSEPYVLTKSVTDQLLTLQSWKQMLQLDSQGDAAYPLGGDLETAFWRTMFADRFQQNEQPRHLAPDDVLRLQAFIEDAQSTLLKYGDDAVIALNDAMASHIIAVLDRRLFQTARGFIGVCPRTAEVGDEVVVLGGCPAPVVLRSRLCDYQGNGQYTALGHCYLHGIMYGEAVGMNLPKRRVYIV